MAYPDQPDFSTSRSGDAWFTDGSAHQVCSLSGAGAIAKVNARLREVTAGENFDTSIFDRLGSYFGWAPWFGSAFDVPSTPVWNEATAFFLLMAFRQWYGDQNPYTVALAEWVRSRSMNARALQAALWFAYKTRGGHVQSTTDGTRGSRTVVPTELIPIGSLELKGDVVVPVQGRMMQIGAPTALSCVAAVRYGEAPNVAGIPTEWLLGGAVAVGLGAFWWLSTGRE